jgi:hypothetical protein
MYWVYVFLFFECFEHMDPFLWNILRWAQQSQNITKATYGFANMRLTMLLRSF